MNYFCTLKPPFATENTQDGIITEKYPLDQVTRPTDGCGCVVNCCM